MVERDNAAVFSCVPHALSPPAIEAASMGSSFYLFSLTLYFMEIQPLPPPFESCS